MKKRKTVISFSLIFSSAHFWCSFFFTLIVCEANQFSGHFQPASVHKGILARIRDAKVEPSTTPFHLQNIPNNIQWEENIRETKLEGKRHWKVHWHPKSMDSKTILNFSNLSPFLICLYIYIFLLIKRSFGKSERKDTPKLLYLKRFFRYGHLYGCTLSSLVILLYRTRPGPYARIMWLFNLNKELYYNSCS